MRNKFLAILLTLCVASAMLPVTLFAEENVSATDGAAGENVIEKVDETDAGGLGKKSMIQTLRLSAG